MAYNIICYYSLHSHTSTICRTISVAISVCTPTHLQYAVQYQLLFLSALPHIYNIPYNICHNFSLHYHTTTISPSTQWHQSVYWVSRNCLPNIALRILYTQKRVHINAIRFPTNEKMYFNMKTHSTFRRIVCFVALYSKLLVSPAVLT